MTKFTSKDIYGFSTSKTKAGTKDANGMRRYLSVTAYDKTGMTICTGWSALDIVQKLDRPFVALGSREHLTTDGKPVTLHLTHLA